MKAHTRLWIDDEGNLTDAPPSRGVLLSKKGGDIPERAVQQYELEMRDGQVIQRGKRAQTPESTPPPLVADRDLWMTGAGALTDKPKAGNVLIASKGEKIARGYVVALELELVSGKVQQKKKPTPPNKAVTSAPNKGAGK